MNDLDLSLISPGANAATCRNLGNALLASGKARECVAYYEQALRLQPDSVEVYNFLGVALIQLRDWERAADCFREALRINPSYVAAYNNLGNALQLQGKSQEALTAFNQALKLQPDNPDIAFNLGVIHDGQGEVAQAVDYYRQALRLKPGSVLVRDHLAAALKEQGFFEEAIDQLREIIKLQPDHALAYANLANFAAEGFYPIQANEMNRIKAFLASGRGSATDRSLCYFAMGAVLDKQGLFDEAFGYFQRGNDLKKRTLQEHNLAFDAQVHHAFIDRIMAAYSQSFFEGVREWGLADELPIFIVGMPRSGTTLVEQILASHPLVFGTGERDDIYRFITQGAATKKSEHYTASLLPNVDAARKLAADYLKYLANLGQGAARVTVKTNENYLHLGLIATLFPRARIIHCRRDPLDICVSCYFQNFQTADFCWSLEDIGAYYRGYERIMAHWSRVLPREIHEVAYEDLVQNQEAVTRDLLAFCGLDWDERCLTYYNTRRAVRTASLVQVRKPIYARAIGRWKDYRTHLGPLFHALGRSD